MEPTSKPSAHAPGLFISAGRSPLAGRESASCLPGQQENRPADSISVIVGNPCTENKAVRVDLRPNGFALIDESDMETVSAYRWYLQIDKSGYRRAKAFKWIAGKLRHVYMHRLILNAPPGAITDHINGDSLDNRKSNLRFATSLENNRNCRKKPGSNPYKGITFIHGRKKPWQARIKLNGRLKSIGYFSDPIEAARAYDSTATKLFGSFARINFPESIQGSRVHR